MKKLYSAILLLLVCMVSHASGFESMRKPYRLLNISKSETLPLKAPAAQTDAEWSEWHEYGTGTFTIDDMFDAFLGTSYEGSYPGVKVDCRQNLTDPTKEQYRFNGIFNNATIVFDFDRITKQLFVQPQEIGIDYFDIPGMAVKAIDSATLWPYLGPDAGYDQATIDDMYAQYSAYNYFIPTLGRFYIYFAFVVDGMDDAVALSDCSLQLDNYPDYTPEIEVSKYMIPGEAKASVSFVEETAYALYAVSNRPHSSAILDYIIEKGETENMIYKITAPGEVKLPTGAHNKVSDLIVITFDKDGEPLEMASKLFTIVDDEADKWKSLGKAGVFCDILEGTVFEIAGNNYEVEVQQNISNPALYRVVDLYGADSPLTTPEQVVSPYHSYIVFDTTDPEMVQVAHTDLGIDMGGGSFIVYADATEKLYGGKSVDDIKAGGRCGTFVDGMISFPDKGLQIICDDFSVFGGTKNAAYGCGGFQLDLDGLSGIENVAVADGQKTTYFNLQGLPVDNPGPGMYIRRQGSKVTKVMVK